MKNVLTAELYRMRRQRSPMVILLVLFGISVISSLYMGLVFGHLPWMENLYQQVKQIYEEMGMVDMYNQFEALRTSRNFENAFQFAAMLIGSDLPLFLMVYFLFFAGKPDLTGYKKHLLTAAGFQNVFYAESLTQLIYSALLVLVSAVGVIPPAFLYFAPGSSSDIWMMLLFLLLMVLLTWTACMLMMTIIGLFIRAPFGVLFAGVYALLLSGSLYTLIDLAVKRMTGYEFYIERFTVFGNFTYMKFGNLWDYLIAFGCIIVYGGLSVLLQFLVVRKRDLF